MIQFRVREGGGLLIGGDCIRVFVSHVEQLPDGYVIDLGVHAPSHVAVNRDAIPRQVHLDKQGQIGERTSVPNRG